MARELDKIDRVEDLHKPLLSQWRLESIIGADNLATHYSALADDGAQAAKKREAALLFVAAEDCLNAAQDAAEAFRAATDAVGAARSACDDDAVADAMRLLLKAHMLGASMARFERPVGGNILELETLAAAELAAGEELARFRQFGCTRGEAAMLLSLAEVNLMRGGQRLRAAALQLATEALALCQRLQDKKLEAATLVALAMVHVAGGDRGQAQEAADAALVHFRAMADALGQARALHAGAIARAMGGTHSEYEDGLELAKEAQAIYWDLGLKRAHASELVTIARLHVEMSNGADGALVAADALEFLRGLDDKAGLRTLAWSALVEAHQAEEHDTEAVQVAREAMAQFQMEGDKRQQALAQDVLAHALLAAGDVEDSVHVARAAVAICMELGDNEWEAAAQLTVSQALSRQKRHEEATDAASHAVALFEGMEGMEDQVGIAHFVLAVALFGSEDYETAVKVAYKARDIFMKARSCLWEAITLVMACALHVANGEFTDALAAALLAQEIFQEANDVRGEALALRALAEIYAARAEFDRALGAAQQRCALLKGGGWRRAEARAMQAIAQLQRFGRQHADASRAARAGLRLARVYGDRAAEVYLMLEVLQSELANLDLGAASEAGAKDQRGPGAEALKLARDAAVLARRLGSRRLEAPALFWQAYTQLLAGIPDALDAASEAAVLFQGMHDATGEAYALLLVAQARFARGDAEGSREVARAAQAAFAGEHDLEGQEAAAKVLQRTTDAEVPGAGTAEQAATPAVEASDQGAVAGLQQPPGLRSDAVRAKVSEIVMDSSDFDGEMDMDTPLMDLGMDSLVSVSFRNELGRAFNQSLPATLVFDYPSINAITGMIMQQA